MVVVSGSSLGAIPAECPSSGGWGWCCAVSGCHTGVTDAQVWRQSLVQALSLGSVPWWAALGCAEGQPWLCIAALQPCRCHWTAWEGEQHCRDQSSSSPALLGWHDLFFSPFLYLQRGLLHHSCSGDQLVMASTGLRASRDWAGAHGVTAWLWKAAACSGQLFSLKTTRQALGRRLLCFLGLPCGFQ